MNSRAEELRNQLLEADPDGIEWKQELPGSDGKPRGPMTWLDAMLSLLTRLAGFEELLARRVRAHVAQGQQPDGTVNGQRAIAGAMLEVLGELARLRDGAMRDGMIYLERIGVPRTELTPQLVGQDWGASSLTDAGVLSLRLRLWMRRSPSTHVELERQHRIAIPRDARAVRVLA